MRVLTDYLDDLIVAVRDDVNLAPFGVTRGTIPLDMGVPFAGVALVVRVVFVHQHGFTAG